MRLPLNRVEILSCKCMARWVAEPAARLNARTLNIARAGASTSVTARIRALIDNYGGLMSRLNAAALGAALLIGISGVAGAQTPGTQGPGVKAPGEKGIEGQRRGGGRGGDRMHGRRGGRGFNRGFAR